MQEKSDHNNVELLKLYLSLSKERRAERFADTAQTAELIGVSQRTVQFWVEQDKIRAVQIGGKLRVDLNSVKAYLLNTANKNSVKKPKSPQE